MSPVWIDGYVYGFGFGWLLSVYVIFLDLMRKRR